LESKIGPNSCTGTQTDLLLEAARENSNGKSIIDSPGSLNAATIAGDKAAFESNYVHPISPGCSDHDDDIDMENKPILSCAAKGVRRRPTNFTEKLKSPIETISGSPEMNSLLVDGEFVTFTFDKDSKDVLL